MGLQVPLLPDMPEKATGRMPRIRPAGAGAVAATLTLCAPPGVFRCHGKRVTRISYQCLRILMIIGLKA
jgi:hypothetical protein